MLSILLELATGYAYAVVLIAMGLVTLMGATVFGLLRLTWWVFMLPGRLLDRGPR